MGDLDMTHIHVRTGTRRTVLNMQNGDLSEEPLNSRLSRKCDFLMEGQNNVNMSMKISRAAQRPRL